MPELRDVLLKSTKTASPIGSIPEDYPNMSVLCRAAHIRYNDHITEKGGFFREWRIVSDDQPAYDKKGNMRGQKTVGHHKFCLAIDYLQHLHPEWSRREILDALINMPKELRDMMSNTWQSMHNKMAGMGIQGYQQLMLKKSTASKDIDVEF